MPVVIRKYDPGDGGLKTASTDANLLAAHGYCVAAQTDTDSLVYLRKVLKGGLRVRTTFDLDVQKAAQTALRQELAAVNRGIPKSSATVTGGLAAVRPSAGASVRPASPSAVTNSNWRTQRRIAPYLTLCEPAALVATMPPRVQKAPLDGSGGRCRP